VIPTNGAITCVGMNWFWVELIEPFSLTGFGFLAQHQVHLLTATL